MEEYEIKVTYSKNVPSLIDGDTVLAYSVVNVVEFIHGTLDDVSKKFAEIRKEHPGAKIICG